MNKEKEFEKLKREVLLCTSQFTDAVPDVCLQENSSNIMVVFENTISEETIRNIHSALKVFGTVFSNSCQKAHFTSFIILRS